MGEEIKVTKLVSDRAGISIKFFTDVQTRFLSALFVLSAAAMTSCVKLITFEHGAHSITSKLTQDQSPALNNSITVLDFLCYKYPYTYKVSHFLVTCQQVLLESMESRVSLIWR